MDKIELLDKKIRLAANKLFSLQQENSKLINEIKFHEKENERIKNLVEENNKLLEERKTVKYRLEKVLKKLNSLKLK